MVAAACGFIALLLAIIPQAAGVIGVDHSECWINTSLDKDDVLEWQIIVFQGWLVLAWVVASVAMMWMLSNVTPVTGGWRQKILAFSLPVVIVVREEAQWMVSIVCTSRMCLAHSTGLGSSVGFGHGPPLAWDLRLLWRLLTAR